jgi:hypothetical protein
LVGSPSKSKGKTAAETIAKNMELLEISKRLVNPPKSADECYFDGESLFEDYENFKEKFRLSAEAKEFPAPSGIATQVSEEPTPEPKIKQIELGGLLNVISSFMSDLQAKQSGVDKIESETTSMQKTEAISDLDVTNLYDDYSKMKKAAELNPTPCQGDENHENSVEVHEKEVEITNQSTDSVLGLEFLIDNKVKDDNLNMEDVFLEYAQMKSMQSAVESGNSGMFIHVLDLKL